MKRTGRSPESSSMDRLLAAIVEDDRPAVRHLLRADPGLAARVTAEARLYDSKIVHWLYAGDTALHLAGAGHRVEIIQGLVGAGADPNFEGKHRWSTPLHYAADGFITGPAWDPGRQVAAIERLLDAGAKIDVRDKNGATPLHRAVRTRSAAAVELLLQRGADPLARNEPGSTPFHLAVQNTGRGGTGAEIAKEAQRQIIRLFLSSGVSPTLPDGNGKTVLNSARSQWIRDLLSAEGGT